MQNSHFGEGSDTHVRTHARMHARSRGERARESERERERPLPSHPSSLKFYFTLSYFSAADVGICAEKNVKKASEVSAPEIVILLPSWQGEWKKELVFTRKKLLLHTQECPLTTTLYGRPKSFNHSELLTGLTYSNGSPLYEKLRHHCQNELLCSFAPGPPTVSPHSCTCIFGTAPSFEQPPWIWRFLS